MELVACCASHATSSRVPSIMKCLQSIAAQSVSVRTYWVWSAENKATAVRVEHALKQHPMIISNFSQKRQSQFEHYQRAVALLPPNCFILFSDDDDFWPASRTAEYCNAVKRIGELYKVTSAIQCPLAKIGSAVRECAEYWTLCVNKQVVSDFFNRFSEKVVLSPVCDLAFYHYVTNYKPESFMTVMLTEVEPLYFYDVKCGGVVWNMRKGVAHYLEADVSQLFESNKRLNSAFKVLSCMYPSPTFLTSLMNHTEMAIFTNRPTVYWRSSNELSGRYKALWDSNFEYVTSILRAWMVIQLDWRLENKKQ